MAPIMPMTLRRRGFHGTAPTFSEGVASFDTADTGRHLGCRTAGRTGAKAHEQDKHRAATIDLKRSMRNAILPYRRRLGDESGESILLGLEDDTGFIAVSWSTVTTHGVSL